VPDFERISGLALAAPRPAWQNPGMPTPPQARPSPAELPGRAFRLVKRLVVEHRPAMQVQTPTPSTWHPDRLTVSCLGHATCLISLGGRMVLTDPALLDRVGVGLPGETTLGPARVTRPALTIPELPTIDVVAVSHAHPDHMDLGTLGRLAWKGRVLIVPRGTRDIVAGCGFADIREIAVGERIDVDGVVVRAVPVAHYGRRHALDRTPGRGYHGYIFERDDRRVFFGGDTAHTVFPPDVAPDGVDVACFGIGAYQPFVWNHATPEQAWDMARQLRARYLLPMHHSTFILSDEPVDEPLQRLLRVAGDDVARVVGRSFGEAFEVPATGGTP
jgi:L-ascorbate metabolism protein UlaG (beta-lactamase superfamily)